MGLHTGNADSDGVLLCQGRRRCKSGQKAGKQYIFGFHGVFNFYYLQTGSIDLLEESACCNGAEGRDQSAMVGLDNCGCTAVRRTR